jgi:hypothetical protein
MLELAACGGPNTTNLHNPPPPPPSNVAVSFQPAPVDALSINASTQITAVVDNDTNNYGVDWLLTCANKGSCGGLSTQHSDSGQPVTYTPPASMPANTESVTITAFATADHTKNVVAPIALSAFASALKGTYVFQTTGMDANGLYFQLAGVLTFDGSGGVSGEQTISNINGFLTTSIQQGSSYFIGGDGRGSITLNTTDQNQQPLAEHFSVVVLSITKALIANLDAPQSAVGTLETQTSTDMPSGAYAFVANGIDATTTPIAFGGVANIDSPGTISGNGSLVDQDYNAAFFECGSPTGLTGTVTQSPPASTGKVVFTLITSVNCFGFAEFTGYIVDSTHIRLIETDGTFITGGLAISQGSAQGTYTNASLFGTYVYDVTGTDLLSFQPATFTGAGFVGADGQGDLTGNTDFFLLGAFAEFREQHGGLYTVDAKGIGRFRLNFNQFFPTPQTTFRPKLIFFLTSPGGPALVMNAGGEELNTPALGTGIAYPQGTPPFSFSGPYGVSFTQMNGAENDGTGQMTAQPTSNPPSLSGAVDDSAGGVGTPLPPLADTFALPDSNGHFTGTFLGTNAAYYLIDSGHGFFVETDLVNPGSGQVGVGYFEVRTPVCDGCH